MACVISLVQLPVLHHTASAQAIGNVDAVVVFDANGKRIGELLGRDEFVHFELPNHVIVRAGVEGAGFQSLVLPTYYLTGDCSGTTYVDARAADNSFAIVPQATIGPPGKTIYQVDLTSPPVIGPIQAVGCGLSDPTLCFSPPACKPCLPLGTVAADTPAGSSTLTLMDASAFPDSGSIAVGSFGYFYSMKTGNTLDLQGTLNAAVSAGATVTQAGDPCAQLPSALLPLLPVVDLDTLYTPPFHGLAASSPVATGCCGDCNGDGSVTVNEIITSVNYALGVCPASGSLHGSH